MSKENLEAGFYLQFFNFLATNKVPVDISPYDAASIMNRVNLYIFKQQTALYYSLHLLRSPSGTRLTSMLSNL